MNTVDIAVTYCSRLLATILHCYMYIVHVSHDLNSINRAIDDIHVATFVPDSVNYIKVVTAHCLLYCTCIYSHSA